MKAVLNKLSRKSIIWFVVYVAVSLLYLAILDFFLPPMSDVFRGFGSDLPGVIIFYLDELVFFYEYWLASTFACIAFLLGYYVYLLKYSVELMNKILSVLFAVCLVFITIRSALSHGLVSLDFLLAVLMSLLFFGLFLYLIKTKGWWPIWVLGVAYRVMLILGFILVVIMSHRGYFDPILIN